MSEILLYKANECISKVNCFKFIFLYWIYKKFQLHVWLVQLSEAQESVKNEIHKLNVGTEKAVEKINHTINELNALIESRRQELLKAVAQTASEKKKVLEEQLNIIEGEKSKVWVQLLHSFTARCLDALVPIFFRLHFRSNRNVKVCSIRLKSGTLRKGFRAWAKNWTQPWAWTNLGKIPFSPAIFLTMMPCWSWPKTLKRNIKNRNI